MPTLRPPIQRSLLCVFALIMACTRGAAAQPEPRNVLLLYSYDREFGPHNAFAGAFRLELSRSSPQPLDFVEVSLQAARSNRRERDESKVAHLRSTFDSRRLDLVVAIGGPAAMFAKQHHQELFPGAPLLLAAVDRRFLESSTLAADEATVAIEHDPPAMVENILRLRPDTTTLIVVIGASQREQFWLHELKHGLRRFEDRLSLIWTNQFSFAEVLARCASLPPHSAIFYAVMSLDAKGVPQVDEQALAELHAAADAPIFGLYTTQLGHGIIGGPLLSLEDLSRNAASAADRMLRGESGRGIAIPTQVAGVPTFDWRELRRWGIDESRLPAGSVVRFRELTVWQRYHRQLVAGATVLLVQGLIVTLLVATLMLRRGHERSLRSTIAELNVASAGLSRLSRNLMQAHEDERARIARDLHENLGQRMVALTVRMRNLSATPHEASGDLRAGLETLARRLGTLTGEILAISDPVYSRLELLGFPAAARTLCDGVSAQHRVIIDFHNGGVARDLPPDVALALFRVLQEALTNAVKHAGVDHLSVSLRADRDAIHLDVADQGAGFDPETASKSNGLGLIGMRERIKLVDGECTIDSQPGAGTRIRVSVPQQQSSVASR
ncbi:MAG TPA: sensor histidine kinase [Vicinamibacterales bacterium]|nr:sensor histidine kinase [Vicinamibacterales bacterium]